MREQLTQRMNELQEVAMTLELILDIKDNRYAYKSKRDKFFCMREEIEYAQDYLSEYIDENRLEEVIIQLEEMNCQELEKLYDEIYQEIRKIDKKLN